MGAPTRRQMARGSKPWNLRWPGGGEDSATKVGQRVEPGRETSGQCGGGKWGKRVQGLRGPGLLALEARSATWWREKGTRGEGWRGGGDCDLQIKVSGEEGSGQLLMGGSLTLSHSSRSGAEGSSRLVPDGGHSLLQSPAALSASSHTQALLRGGGQAGCRQPGLGRNGPEHVFCFLF